MWLLILWTHVAAVTPTVPIALPAEIKTTLDHEYPGWILAPVNAAVQKEFNQKKTHRLPSLTYGDFDRNGKRDYAIQIALTAMGQEEQIVIIFLQHIGTYAEHIVLSMGLDPSTYLWAQKKAVPETGPDALEKLVSKDVLMILGSPAGETTYAYENGKFIELDNKEEAAPPNSEIPRVTPPL